MADDLGSKIHAASELFGDQKWCNWRIIECSTNSLGNSLSGAALYPCPLVGGWGSLAPTISSWENLSRWPSFLFITNYRIIELYFSIN